MNRGKIDSGVNRVNRDMFLYYFNWQEQNFLSVFTMISFFLCFFFFYCSDQYKLGTENMKPPFSLTFNLQYIIFPYFYLFIFQKEQNLTRSSFSRNQEFILSVLLVGFCLIVIVGVMLYLFKRRVLLRQKTYVISADILL